MRTTFVRELKKVKKKSGNEGPAYVSRWLYYSKMLLLADTVRHRE